MAGKPKKQSELAKRKATLDKELEEYALVRKGAIKDAILAENSKLVALTEELAQTATELEAKKSELTELNDIYRDEQAELRQSSAETQQILADNREQVAKSQDEVTEVRHELGELLYKRDQLMLSLTKAREEHDKFIEYEKQARKELADKDLELQKKAADIGEGNQFLKNSRAHLAEL